MLVPSSIRGNAAAAKAGCLSQVEKRYVTNTNANTNAGAAAERIQVIGCSL
jgi:hypothetical protein